MARGRTSPRGEGRTVGANSAAGGRGGGFRDAVADVEYDPMEFGDGEVEGNLLLDSVVKLYCVHTEPNYSLPWQRKRQFTSTSSAFAIPGRRILTNAHSVEYNTQVKVKKRGDDTRFLAKVLAISVECDIALLTVVDENFWEDLHPLDFGPLPHLQDQVAVVGYPIGGDTISITSGIVSRVEVTSYTHGASELLAIQIDAAINSGNSGGPVFNSRGQCCGIAFQSLVGDDAENIGYVIPPPVIQHFLEDFKRNGEIAGFPVLGIQWQRLESPSLRASLAMEAQTTGVLVAKTAPVSDAHSKLQRGDVIMSFEGVKVSNNGTVPFRSGERINFSYLVSQHYVGDVVRLTVLRQKEKMEVEVTLSTPSLLVPVHIGGKMPPYLIVAGLVFTPLCEPYLRSEYGEHYYTDSPVKLLDAMLHQFPTDATEEVVILSQVLACDATVGYEEVRNTRLFKVNGEKVHNLRHLADLVDGVKGDPFLRLESEYDEVIVLEMSKVAQATAETLETHAIPADRSPDLLSSN